MDSLRATESGSLQNSKGVLDELNNSVEKRNSQDSDPNSQEKGIKTHAIRVDTTKEQVVPESKKKKINFACLQVRGDQQGLLC